MTQTASSSASAVSDKLFDKENRPGMEQTPNGDKNHAGAVLALTPTMKDWKPLALHLRNS